MKFRPEQGLTVISKKILLKQNDHASRRTQRSPHTRRNQHRPKPPPTSREQHSTPPTKAASRRPRERRERYSSLTFRRPAIRYSVGEIESLFRKILARPSP